MLQLIAWISIVLFLPALWDTALVEEYIRNHIIGGSEITNVISAVSQTPLI
jgi:hypothetical protein